MTIAPPRACGPSDRRRHGALGLSCPSWRVPGQGPLPDVPLGLAQTSGHARRRLQGVELPNRQQVQIGRRKVTGYLLAVAHPVGGAKARYFESRGYSIDAPEQLEETLRQIAVEGTVTKEETTDFGKKYVVEGSVTAPDGNPLVLATVWIVDRAGVPVLVTAYPTARKL